MYLIKRFTWAVSEVLHPSSTLLTIQRYKVLGISASNPVYVTNNMEINCSSYYFKILKMREEFEVYTTNCRQRKRRAFSENEQGGYSPYLLVSLISHVVATVIRQS